MNPLLTKPFRAAATVGGNLIVRATTTDGSVQQAAGSADPSIGISRGLGGSTGQVIDVDQIGWSELRLGGTVAAGDKLTSDAQGRGITAVRGVAAVQVIAIAMRAGVSGDIIPVLIAPSILAST